MLHRCTHASCQKQYHSNKRETNYITAQTNRVDVIMSQCLWWLYESRDVIRHLLSPDVPHGFTRPAPICLSVSRVISFLSILFTCLFPNRAHKEPAWTLIHCLRGLWVSDICGCKLREKRKRNGEKKYWRWKLETSEHYKPLLIPKGSRLHVALHVDITERSDWGI